MLEFSRIREALDRQPLFEDKTWMFSPEPWPLSEDQVQELRAIGDACLEFHGALETLYLRSAENRNLLRNKKLVAPWVAKYLDRGKPLALIQHARSKRLRGACPVVIRPDLLWTEEGFALTEMDSVPGAIGLTGFLNQLYEASEPGIIGHGNQMVECFYESLAALTPHLSLPLIGIFVSDESSTYRPEMEWLADSLKRAGKRVYCVHPNDVIPLGNTICIDIEGNPEQVDIIYRFWEMFDLSNVPIAEYILQAWEESEVVVSPPMRPFQEEKLALALFNHHLLQEFWRENMSKRSVRLLKRIVPSSWIMDPVDLPPNAVLDGPLIGGNPIWNWDQLGEASQKERNLIIKLSGFHEDAWGARSVVLGSDVSRNLWRQSIQSTVDNSAQNLSILQEYKKPMRLRHPVYRDADSIFEMEGRLRLEPFYFVRDNATQLAGVLATYCPADKKIIHGMRDAAMLPCSMAFSSS